MSYDINMTYPPSNAPYAAGTWARNPTYGASRR